jgi:hypothetical protein
MATRTLGTAATTTLTALQFVAGMVPADLATMNAAIKNDIPAAPVQPNCFQTNGTLFIPRRGILQLIPGDFVAFDPATGWPILLSATAAAGASYVHT